MKKNSKVIQSAGFILLLSLMKFSFHCVKQESQGNKISEDISFHQSEPVPVISRMHTVSVHIQNHKTFNDVLNLLTEDLGFILMWGRKADSDDEGKRVYAGVSAGNIMIEPCGPYDHIEYASKDFDAIFFGITFEPHISVTSSVPELDRRNIQHNEPTTFMVINDSLMVGQNSGIGFYNIKDPIRSKTERDSIQNLFEVRDGGPLGFERVAEIQVGYSDEIQLLKWKSFLKPATEIEDNVWCFDRESPTIRFIASDIKETLAIVLKVRSIETAKSYLKQRGMLGNIRENQVQLNPDKTFGLKIFIKD
jgi:hypothetical protein